MQVSFFESPRAVRPRRQWVRFFESWSRRPVPAPVGSFGSAVVSRLVGAALPSFGSAVLVRSVASRGFVRSHRVGSFGRTAMGSSENALTAGSNALVFFSRVSTVGSFFRVTSRRSVPAAVGSFFRAVVALSGPDRSGFVRSGCGGSFGWGRAGFVRFGRAGSFGRTALGSFGPGRSGFLWHPSGDRVRALFSAVGSELGLFCKIIRRWIFGFGNANRAAAEPVTSAFLA